MRPLINILLISALILPSLCFSQEALSKKIIHIIDTSYHNVDENDICLHKLLIMNEKGIYELFEIRNRLEDFVFKCIFLSCENSLFIVFENYGSSAGISKLYYIRESDYKIFESDPLYEYEIPIYRSFDDGLEIFKSVSFRKGECGNLENRNVKSFEKSVYKLIDDQIFRSYKLLNEIPF